MHELIAFVRDYLADIREHEPKKRLTEINAATAREAAEMEVEVSFATYVPITSLSMKHLVKFHFFFLLLRRRNELDRL